MLFHVMFTIHLLEVPLNSESSTGKAAKGHSKFLPIFDLFKKIRNVLPFSVSEFTILDLIPPLVMSPLIAIALVRSLMRKQAKKRRVVQKELDFASQHLDQRHPVLYASRRSGIPQETLERRRLSAHSVDKLFGRCPALSDEVVRLLVRFLLSVCQCGFAQRRKQVVACVDSKLEKRKSPLREQRLGRLDFEGVDWCQVRCDAEDKRGEEEGARKGDVRERREIEGGPGQWSQRPVRMLSLG